MKTKTILALALAGIILAAPLYAETENTKKKTTKKNALKNLTADVIMKNMDNQQEPDDMISEMTMTLINKKNYKKVRSVLTARQGKDNTIMWFLSPPEVKGSSFLSTAVKGKTSMWIYLPGFKKITLITSRGKKGRFMGSNFSYEDLEGRKYEDYNYKLLGVEKINGRECYIVESRPKTSIKNPPYGKIISWVWKERFMALKEEYYDKMNKLKKIQTIDNIKKIKNYRMPEKVTMENVQKKNKTVIDFNNILLDSGIDKNIFHKRSLTRILNKKALYKKKINKPKETKEKKND